MDAWVLILEDFYSYREKIKRAAELEKKKNDLLHGHGGQEIFRADPSPNVYMDGVGILSLEEYERRKREAEKNSPWWFTI